MGKLFLQDNNLQRKGNDPLEIEGNELDVARALADCGTDSPFFLPSIFLSFSPPSRMKLEFAMTLDPDLNPWWSRAKSIYARLNGLLSWRPKDLDVVWSAKYATTQITEVLRVSSGQVFVVMQPCDHDVRILSEIEFNLESAELLDDHLRDSALRATANAENIIAVIRSPMVSRAITLSDGKSVGTIHRRGPSAEDCGGWVLNEPETHVIVGEEDVK